MVWKRSSCKALKWKFWGFHHIERCWSSKTVGVQQAPAANNNQRVFQKDPSTPPAQFHTWSNHGQVCFFLLMLFSLEKRSAKHGKTSLTRGHILAQKKLHCQKHSETTLPRCQGIEMAKGLEGSSWKWQDYGRWIEGQISSKKKQIVGGFCGWLYQWGLNTPPAGGIDCPPGP